jgi:hypothetical protein
VVASAKYEANAKSQPTLLDLGKAYPNAAFTAVVYRENRAKIRDPRNLPPRQAYLCDGEDYRWLCPCSSRADHLVLV